MANYVSLVALDGAAVGVNPEEVASLQPVPAALLPSGVVAGTYVQSEDGSRVGVQGTVAATIAALAVGTTIQRAIIDGATGNILAASVGGITASVRNGAGDYTITRTATPGGAALLVTADGGAGVALIASAQDTAATTFDVFVSDNAGVATDAVQLSIAVIPIA